MSSAEQAKLQWKAYVDYLKGRGNIEEVMIIDANDGSEWASTSKDFYLRQYKAMITQEDGNEREETVNEADNILEYIKGKKPSQGLRINGVKQQVLRSFKDDDTSLSVIYGKVTMGGTTINHAGKAIVIASFNELNGHTSNGCNEVCRLISVYLCKSSWPDSVGEKKAADSATNQPAASSAVAKSSSSNNQSNYSTANRSASKGSGNVDAKAYFDEMLACGHVAAAAVISQDGGILIKSEDLQLSTYEAEIAQEDGSDKMEVVDEVKNIVQLMKTRSKPSQGLRLGKVKYQVLRTFDDDNSSCFTVYGKKTMGGCCIVITKAYIILATFDELKGHTAAACNEVVSNIAKGIK